MIEYSQKTDDIIVRVRPHYLSDESIPEEDHYVWMYHVKIENNGNDTIQLINRSWRITDSHGSIQKVDGPGVIGKQPVLKPSDKFEYASGTYLDTPSGIMTGSYEMQIVGEEERMFSVAIPTFSLDSTEQKERPN